MTICTCGCGQEIPWKKHHIYWPPKYLQGHYSKSLENRIRREAHSIKPPTNFKPSGFCECGCGQKTPIAPTTNAKRCRYKGYPIRYIHGHHNRGKRAHGWKGGRKQNKLGYWFVFMPDHHLAYKYGYVPEHRLIWEEHNGRRLLPSEHVHHIDGKPSNNSPENLVAITRVEHLKIHNSSPEARLKKSVENNKRFQKPEEHLKMSIAAKKGWETRRKNKH